MANRTKRKQKINSDWFRWVCNKRNVSMNGLARLTGWSSRQIRDGVNGHEMTPELLDACAQALDVHPNYLRGDYCWTLQLEIMKKKPVKEHWLSTSMAPDAHPYKYFKQSGINLSDHFRNTLLLHGVNLDEFDKLDCDKRTEIEEVLNRSQTISLRRYFPKAVSCEWASYSFDDAFSSEGDVIESMLDWLSENGIATLA